MSNRQDKATTERHAKTLRELLKRPENKFCADCKRNDPRWASWNLGVFLCIRCSGIHRSMGTHISKVKSVDLDVWTPEQMASITRWGNRYANLYWEAHLRPGHIPPDHKMDSFIRSKYESKRWAREGPPPSDPSTLDDGSSAHAPAPQSQPQTPTTATAPRPSHGATSSISSVRGVSVTTRQPQAHQLLSTTMTNRTATPSQPPLAALPAQQQQQQQPAQTAPAQTSAANDLFSLDFHNPVPSGSATSPTSAAPKKDVKQDILSLFSSPPAVQTTSAFATQNVWGAPAPVQVQPQHQFQPQVQPQAQAATTSMVGQNGVGMWGTSSGWAPTPVAPAQPSIWGSSTTATPGAPSGSSLGGFGQPQPQAQGIQPQHRPQQQSLFNTNDIWASPSTGTNGNGGGDLFGSSMLGQQKKDDAFGDIWGGFK